MTGLETTFYITAIIFMSVMLILITALVTVIVVIRNKIVALEKSVQDKLHSVTMNVNKAVEVVEAVRDVARAVKGR